MVLFFFSSFFLPEFYKLIFPFFFFFFYCLCSFPVSFRVYFSHVQFLVKSWCSYLPWSMLFSWINCSSGRISSSVFCLYSLSCMLCLAPAWLWNGSNSIRSHYCWILRDGSRSEEARSSHLSLTWPSESSSLNPLSSIHLAHFLLPFALQEVWIALVETLLKRQCLWELKRYPPCSPSSLTQAYPHQWRLLFPLLHFP